VQISFYSWSTMQAYDVDTLVGEMKELFEKHEVTEEDRKAILKKLQPRKTPTKSSPSSKKESRFTLLSIGEPVSGNKNWCTKNHIFLNDYSVRVKFGATCGDDYNAHHYFTCSITKVDDLPHFTIDEDNCDVERIEGSSATGVWSEVLKRRVEFANTCGEKPGMTQISGTQYFGLEHFKDQIEAADPDGVNKIYWIQKKADEEMAKVC